MHNKLWVSPAQNEVAAELSSSSSRFAWFQGLEEIEFAGLKVSLCFVVAKFFFHLTFGQCFSAAFPLPFPVPFAVLFLFLFGSLFS